MNQQKQSPPTSEQQNFAMAKWLIQFPALTLMVLIRRDIGYRLLNTGIITCGAGLFFFVTMLPFPSNDARKTLPLLLFALLGFVSAIVQKIRRWREFNQGIVTHSYYLGSSPFAFSWLPGFMLDRRRVARFGDPIICAIVGMLLFPFFPVLSVWTVFSALCLRAYEHQVFQREESRRMDFGDSIIEAEIVIEEQNPTPRASQTEASTGIPSGLGDDIGGKIHRK